MEINVRIKTGKPLITFSDSQCINLRLKRIPLNKVIWEKIPHTAPYLLNIYLAEKTNSLSPSNVGNEAVASHIAIARKENKAEVILMCISSIGNPSAAALASDSMRWLTPTRNLCVPSVS